MPRGGRERVVPVVPGLAQGEGHQPPDVPGLIARLELLLAEVVAGGIDGPGGMGDDEEADEAAPEDAHAETGPSPGERPADGSRDQEAENDEERGPLLHPEEKAFTFKIRRKLPRIDGLFLEENVAVMRKAEGLQGPPESR